MSPAVPRRPPPPTAGGHGGPAGAPPEPKLDLGVQWRPETHRSGWPYALDSLAGLHTPGGVLLEGFVEKKFAWGRDPGDLRNDPRPHTRPWIGFWHNPPAVHERFRLVGHGHAPDDILTRGLWRESAPYCLGLFTLSRHLQRWLAARVPVPVCSLLHPTGPPSAGFSARRYANNPRKKIVQIGWWLRRFDSLCDLEVPGLEKAALSPFPGAPDWYTAQGWADYGAASSVTQLAYLDDHAYDELLAENIVFLDLYDSSANNAIVECIARLTPVLVNPLPAVVEYLGAGYPLYFTDLREAAAKAQDMQRVIAAHQYLRDSPVRQRLTGDQFRWALAQSAIYRQLPPVPAAASPAGRAPGGPCPAQAAAPLPQPRLWPVRPAPQPPVSARPLAGHQPDTRAVAGLLDQRATAACA